MPRSWTTLSRASKRVNTPGGQQQAQSGTPAKSRGCGPRTDVVPTMTTAAEDALRDRTRVSCLGADPSTVPDVGASEYLRGTGVHEQSTGPSVEERVRSCRDRFHPR